MKPRDATAGEGASLAAAVAGQPLLARYGTTAASLARSLDDAIARGEGLLCVEREGAIAGFAWFLEGGTLALGGYLRLIALAPGEEGRGTGGALLDAVEARVKARSRHLFLLVTKDNQGARRFYQRRGYATVGELPELVRPGLDELLLWKRL